MLMILATANAEKSMSFMPNGSYLGVGRAEMPAYLGTSVGYH